MWPRVAEVALGCWLLLMPLVFRETPGVDGYATSALVSGGIIAIASLASVWRPARFARFGTLAVSIWLMLHGYFSAPRPGPPAAQNEVVVGLIVALFAILPNETNDIPTPWRTRTNRTQH